MQIQKEVISIQKQQAVKSVQVQKTRVKKDMKSKVVAKKWL